MNMDEIKLDIRRQVAKTDNAFTNHLGIMYRDGLLIEDTNSLYKHLKNINRFYQIYKVLSITFSAFLIFISIPKYFNLIDLVDMNKAGLMILFTLVFIIETYRYYKLKVNLENKIYLLKLLEIIDRKQTGFQQAI